ncbi:hypothetical protein LTR56_013513 [Elasticomyces elasticus]|nr:hypothetical protein LTR56_013513 [Elasticomyces elasticus]KAK3649530.1 hypothetical protein LTR22_012887 [Elasticomyces elasticus]KAK4933052.1 hypothetical protein LTR49_000536 [Elasticomyces elasticus]
MVSHHHLPSYSGLPPLAPSAPPAVPRAASVTSGRSQTRRHRHARTHHGGSGSTYTPQNEFPVFSHTGDVEIIVTSSSGRRENRYLLHRLILSQCSGFFQAGTRAEWSGQQPSNALARINENESVTAGSSSRASSLERRSSQDMQPKQRWKYVLDWQHARDDAMPMLVRQDEPPSLFGGGPPSSRTQPPVSNEGFFRNMTNFSALNLNERTQASAPAESGDEVLKDHDNLFRIMYNYAPILDSINIATAYTECKALLHLADMYDALEIVGSRVDHHLLRFGARLFKQIAKYPPSYLKLGYLARSRTLFTEALIHVVGQWPLAAPQLRGQMEAVVMDLIEDKVDELHEQQEKVEFKLWRLTLTTSRGERVTPANDYLAWLAMSLFRQWVAENTTPPVSPATKDSARQGSSIAARPNSRSSSSNHIASQRAPPPPPPPAPSPPSQGKVYRLLGSSDPQAYLNHDELKRFLKLQPELYTRDNLRRFERRMDEIKNQAREVVKPLMWNLLELDLSTFGSAGLGYLTCVRLEQSELPWDD